MWRQNTNEPNELQQEVETLRNLYQELSLSYLQLRQRIEQLQQVLSVISDKCTQDALDTCKNIGTISDLQAGLVDGLNSN